MERLETRLVLNTGPLLISEFMADNDGILADVDGQYSDWIEIHNPTGETVDLDGWYLTDDEASPAKWEFPTVILEPGAYTVVFASGKNRRDPAAQLHTNFQLDADGEYLALMQPDAATVADAYADEFPDQSTDVSYGVWQEVVTLVGDGDALSYHVPTAADEPSETAWTGLDFDDSDWTGGPEPSPVLITEAYSGSIDWFEIQNVSDEPAITAGWVVAVNDAHESINDTYSTVWELPDTIAPGEVLYRTDPLGDNPLANDLNIFWKSTGGGWVLILDGEGNVADFLVWGYEDADVASFSTTINGWDVTLGPAWNGSAVTKQTMGTISLQRQGNEDNNSAGDFDYLTEGEQGTENAGLLTPFPSVSDDPPITGVGFGGGPDGFGGAIRTDVGAEMLGHNASLWSRIAFAVDDPSTVGAMTLRMKYNDGFVAYLNGQEIAGRNAPDDVHWNSAATDTRSLEESSAVENFSLMAAVNLLQGGKNVLAVQGLNVHPADDDFLILPELVLTQPRNAQRFFFTPTPGGPNTTGLVVINEIHYDPSDKMEPVEFVELHNAGGSMVDLSDWYFSSAIDYVFPEGTTLAAGEFLVVARDPDAVQTKYGVAGLGPFEGRLSNDGETLVLRDTRGVRRDRVDYRLGFPWPTTGGAPGYSIELIHPALDNDLGGSWRSSSGGEISGPTPGAVNSTYADNGAPQMRQVRHAPKQPTSAAEVPITVKVTDPDGVADVTLQYQLVNPGNYIRSTDAAYTRNWTALAMTDDGTGGDQTAGDNVYTLVLPGELQTHRRLVRYRITATDTLGASVTAPYADDPQPNFAYFVYDGVPTWTGADRPGVTNPVTFDTDVMNSLPTYHLLSQESDVLDCQYNSAYNDKNFRFAGTLVVDGEVYDHIRYRIRGAGSTYVAGKNKWKFRFNRGHYFQGYDQYGNAWAGDGNPVKLRTLNFGSVASPWGPANRGMAGMDEALAFELLNLTGVAAPHLSPLQFRVIDRSVEANPNNQYDGDLWGLYVAFENPGGRFLDSHGLPDGNLYRFDWSAELENQGTEVDGTPLPSSLSFVNNFVTAYNQPHTVAWWRENVDLDSYYSFRAVAEALNHTDWTEKHNMLLFYNPDTAKWSMLPWDMDLLYEEFDRWGPDGMQSHLPYEQFRKMLVHEELNIEFQARARELQDLLLNDNQGWQMLEEYARYVEPMAAVDRAMWDYHPRAGSWHRGAYYQEVAPTPRYPAYPRRAISPVGFEGMVNWVKEFIAVGGFGGDQLRELHLDANIPRTPTIGYTGTPGYPLDNLTFQTTSFRDPQGSQTFGAMEWRLGEVTDPSSPTYDPALPTVYELAAVWESGEMSGFDGSLEMPGHALQVGHTYRARVRMQDNTGRWSHWSDAVEFVAAAPTGPMSPGLLITEIMAHATDPTPEELAVDGDLTADDFDFLELQNTSNTTLNLAGYRIADGIQFDFDDGSVNALAAGQFVVVAKNPQALQLRHELLAGAEPILIAGAYTRRLDDDGERITLVDAAGTELLDFRYNVSGSWPGRADGKGGSLELINPADVPLDRALRTEFLEEGDHWRGSGEYGGTPGTPGEGPRGDVLINEVLTHTDPPVYDSIELYNNSAAPIQLGGWYLSDSGRNYRKYQIPEDTVLGVGEYLVFNELDHFNPTPSTPDANAFALNGAHGDDVWLLQTGASGELVRFVDHVEFGAAANGESFGRWPNAQGRLYPMREPSLGSVNVGPHVGPVVISELMYNPTVPNAQADPNDFEYIEIHNPTLDAVDLTDWRIRKGIDFDFPAGSSLSAGESLLVVSFAVTDAEKLAALQDHYQFDPAVRIMGPYSGQLNDDGEKVQLQRPDAPPLDEPDYIPRLIEDEVVYGDVDPWPTDPDGAGTSLTRQIMSVWGNDAANWTSEAPTPGMVTITDDAYEPNNSLAAASLPAVDWSDTPLSAIAGLGIQADPDWYRIDVAGQQRHLTVDVTFSHALGNIDVQLVDSSGSVHAASQSTTDNEQIDVVLAHPGTWYLNVFGDNTAGAYDLVYSASYLHPGDADLDGATDLSDFNIWNAKKFMTGTDWTTGDFNGDGNTDLSDFNVWNAFKFTTAAPPEPAPPAATTQASDDPAEAINELAWLRERDQSGSKRSSGTSTFAAKAVDRLLATYW